MNSDAHIYFEDDYNAATEEQQTTEAVYTSKIPKKLIKKGGKKGNSGKHVTKLLKGSNDPDDKFAQGGLITFQKDEPEHNVTGMRTTISCQFKHYSD